VSTGDDQARRAAAATVSTSAWAILLAWLHHTAAICRQDAGQPKRDVR
jgi:hypothetical protein